MKPAAVCRVTRGLCALWLVAALSASALPAWAARHALLVGVSAYPALGERLQLTGPAHDVRGMRDALRLRGFEPAHIHVLADGVHGAQGLPTRDAILAALEDLARRAQAGDTVVVLLSGHGSQEPAVADGPHQEPDGWRETFLPRDVGRWDGKRGGVDRALSDQALRLALDRIGNQGAFVWAIFDACHSGTLVRGDERIGGASRQVAPAELGVPGVPPSPAQARLRAQEMAGRQAGAPADRRAVYFYAAQSGESVKNLRLPREVRNAPEQGLLSFSIASALASGQAMTYRQLAQHVLAQYGAHHASATPLFSGDGLDGPVLNQRAPIYRQWPLDNRLGRLTLPAGTLDGIGAGALFSVLSEPLSVSTLPPRDGSAGVLKATKVEGARSELEPIAWSGRPPTAAASLASGTYARLLGSPPSLALRVAIDRSACQSGCAAIAAIEHLVGGTVPGVDLRWVGSMEPSDIVLQATPAGVRYVIGETPAPATLGTAVPRGTPAAEAATRIAADLHAFARARNLLALAGQFALRTDTPVLQTSLHVRATDRQRADRLLRPDQVLVVRDGEGLVLRIHNPGSVAVDLTLLLIDGNHGVTVRYPLDRGESNRLEPNATLEIADMTVNTHTTGTERLVLIWNGMGKHRERRDFSFLQQSPLSRVRTAADVEPAFQALMDACFADQLTRGEPPALPAVSMGMRVYTLEVAP